jgi:hypothetical protein
MDKMQKTSATLALFGALSTVACHRNESKRALATSGAPSAQSVSSVAPIAASSTKVATSASAQAAMGASPDGAPEWGETHEPNCSPALLGQLQTAIAHLYDNPPGPQIEKVEHPVAYAYTALLRWTRGDESGSERALHRIPYDAAKLARAVSGSRESRIEQLLSFVYETEYVYVGYACRMPGGAGAETWCGIFEKYPNEALSAFGQQGGSVVDAYSSAQKHQCAVHLVQDHGSPKLARDFAAALTMVTPAIYGVAAHPLGTGYSVLLTVIDDLLQEPIFGVSRVERPDPKKLADAIDDAGRYIRDLDARLARFRQAESRIAAGLGTAYCGMAEYRGRPLSSDACRSDAKARLETALQMWLEERPFASLHIDAKGQAYDPKPWR